MRPILSRPASVHLALWARLPDPAALVHIFNVYESVRILRVGLRSANDPTLSFSLTEDKGISRGGRSGWIRVTYSKEKTKSPLGGNGIPLSVVGQSRHGESDD